MRLLTRTAVTLLLASRAVAQHAVAHHAVAQPARPTHAVDAVLRAFATRPVVALGERHAWEEERRFALALARDPRFARTVDDVVVECGSSKYQALANRYVAGADVSRAELQRVWRSTSAITLSPPSICGEIFDVARAANARASRARAPRRLRVLLGQPPVEWYEVTDSTRLDTVPLPDVFLARLVRDSVIAKGRKALLVVGAGHVVRRATPPSRPTLVQQIESAGPGSVFAVLPFDGFGDTPGVHALEERLTSWPVPSLAALAGTWLGAVDAATLYSTRAMKMVNGQVVEVDVQQHVGDSLAVLADALLWLGDRASMTRTLPTAAELADSAFIAELDRRSRVQFHQPFRPTPPGERRLFPDARPAQPIRSPHTRGNTDHF